MLAASENLPETNFREKVRCGEVYRNLNGNEMFQKFYYRCSECSIDFESSTEFEEHVIAHYLQDDSDETAVENVKSNENIINLSSDEDDNDNNDDNDDDDEAENDYLYAFEVASLVEENISENDLPLPLMQMLGEHTMDNSCGSDDDDDKKRNACPCDGLRRQALAQYSEHCCTQCPAYFNTKSELIFHLHVHTLPNTVACQHCYEVFPSIPKLNEHLNNTAKRKSKRDDDGENNVLNSKKAKSQMGQINDKVAADSSQECFANMVEQHNDSDKWKDSSTTVANGGNGGSVEKLIIPQMDDVSHNNKNFISSNDT